MPYRILENDPQLAPFEKDIRLRMDAYAEKKKQLLSGGGTLSDFANGFLYFGFHPMENGWVFREWAPGADRLFLTGDFCDWKYFDYPMTRLDNGVWELTLAGRDALKQNQRVMLVVQKGDRTLCRIPSYATRVVQDPVTGDWNAVIRDMPPFSWTDGTFRPRKPLFIYECHIGMAQEEGKVGTYTEFRENILPRIRDLGYNTIQIMAIMEHPYYASFGYQVTNFFAASSRYGTPEELKELINAAHGMGIAVLLDVVHSHASKNTREGLGEFDGTVYQYFHDGAKGEHSAWDTRCFDYGKNEVLHFLLSNLKFWQTEYHFDGFRFDGVTSMLYHDHGLGTAFDSPGKYFSMNTHIEAITYLQLASELVRQVDPHAILIAEDMSAMPGMCLPISDGGIGFDYRLAMGEPDLWVRLLTEQTDENWDLNRIYYELSVRRPGEKVIGYCESHDQALVGDKTILFRLCDQQMYWSMDKRSDNILIDRGMALHKLLRLITMSLGGEGYLTFMGNEFGHPEWIDFPREGNGWSYHYCRRQWSLADNPELHYGELRAFEKAMVHMALSAGISDARDQQLRLDNTEKVLAYRKGELLFGFNFHPWQSYEGCFLPVWAPGKYRVILSSDDAAFGGHDRISHRDYDTTEKDGVPGILLYLPSRTAAVLQRVTRGK